MKSVVQGELATLDSHEQINHWGTTQLVQMAFNFDCFTWSFKISYKSLMELYVLYMRGKVIFLCFSGGGHLYGGADSRLERHFRFFVTHYLPSAGNYEIKLKWSTNLIFTEEKLLFSRDIKCSWNSSTDTTSATALSFFLWGCNPRTKICWDITVWTTVKSYDYCERSIKLQVSVRTVGWKALEMKTF